METDVPTGTKRGSTSEPADSSSGSAKKAKVNGMELPGTGGGSSSDPDTGNPSTENCVIPRPLNNLGGHKLVFRKHHSLLSYGLAWKISRLSPTGTTYLTTTSLMAIPVELPFLYLSPAEWHWLQDIRGLQVDNVRVKIIMRNPRTAFETNATSTTLATLNQNKYLGVAKGLNLSTRGIDRAMKFGSGTDAMVNQGTEEYDITHMNKFIEAAYGTIDNRPDVEHKGFQRLPCSFLYLPFINNRYYCSVATHNDVNKDIGWPDLTQYITKADASFTTRRVIAEYSYSPKIGLLTQPFQMRLNGYYGEDATALKRVQDNAIDSDVATGEASSIFMPTIDIESDEWKALTKRTGSAYTTPIEKSQYIKRGMFDTGDTSLQPSMHVGVFPVPRLTTSDLKTRPEKFTDVEVQWDVETEMHLSYNYGTMNLTHYDKPYLEPMESGHYVTKLKSTDANTYFQTQYSTVNGEFIARVNQQA
ncbi:uncharacterized protein LOC126845473 [Adelges cooleyi]|uniref:uncharacterized protein LOC126845473 n=1 Tax=Adelges cooleyi TaxID=133065 RepID=UPI00217F7BB4|nr:uncharacterized protein LOC126845473 [Adelges cooleyi]